MKFGNYFIDLILVNCYLTSVRDKLKGLLREEQRKICAYNGLLLVSMNQIHSQSLIRSGAIVEEACRSAMQWD